jgi:DNA-binding transcriptional ArsR family regulator
MTLIKALKALADEKRLEILRKLLNSDLCVGALARHLGVSKPAVSQHLQILRKAGLVLGEKRGYWTHYMVERQALIRLAAELNRLAAEVPPCGPGCRRISAMPASKPPKEALDMCQNCCQQPARLKDKLDSCSPEQIPECHGDLKDHPCTPEDRGPQAK